MVLAPGLSVHDPRFEIDIADQQVGLGIQELVQSVEYESADGMADVAKVTLQNPDGVLTDLKLFQPGNEMSIRMGYGSVEHVGRVVLIAASPNFPQDGMPTLQVTGYTKDHQMMDDEPEAGKKRIYQKPAEIGDILQQVASRHGFDVNADGFEFGRTMTQKAGLSDYDLVVGLANMAGAAFWVEGDADGNWILNWRLPKDDSTFPDLQESELTFRYGDGDLSTLFSFQPEFAIRDASTKLKVIVRNPQTGKTFIEEFDEDPSKHPDAQAGGDPTEEVDGEPATGGAAKLFFGNFSFDLVPNKKFKDEAQVRKWAAQWFRRNRENFVTAQGKLIGIPSLRARQVHNIEGVGRTFSGRYYFATVTHKFSDSEGYVCNFSARKVLP